jgi:hypothetical protein
MRRKIFGVLPICLVLLVLFTGFNYSLIDFKKSDEVVNKVIMRVTLPDSTVLKATIEEGGLLEISNGIEIYQFTPTITDNKSNSVVLEAIGNSNDCSQIQYEIIDVITIPKDKFQKLAGCSNGRCCVTCNGWTACGCAAEFEECNKSCCCDPCCPEDPIE